MLLTVNTVGTILFGLIFDFGIKTELNSRAQRSTPVYRKEPIMKSSLSDEWVQEVAGIPCQRREAKQDQMVLPYRCATQDQ